MPAEDQRQLLYDAMLAANAACNAISATAWEQTTFGRFALHHLMYHRLRADGVLSAQTLCLCIGKVADAYKHGRETRRQFKKLGAIPYDARVLNYRPQDNRVSIWLLGGRQLMPFVCGEHQQQLLQYQQGESDLVYHKGEFYLYAACELPDGEAIDAQGWVGVDLGIINIAVDSDGVVYSASHINNVRHRHRRLRRKLQAKGTKSARRRLKSLSGQEARFAKDVNHTISKRLVHKAKGTLRGIALEDLNGIAQRVTVRQSQRSTLHSWSFYQLRQFIEYKARMLGVPVVLVDPTNTSRTCPACGCVDKRNRPAQSTFSCVQCGCAGLADHFAAVEISRRAAVNRPYVSTHTFSTLSA